jgi:hypothetical protein
MGSKRKRGTEKVFKEIKTKISKFRQETFTHRIKKISKPTPNMMNQKKKKKRIPKQIIIKLLKTSGKNSLKQRKISNKSKFFIKHYSEKRK